MKSYLEALEARHLARLTLPELRRALQALSQIYVQKREKLRAGAVFDGAGKRAAFALFYGPLHYLLTLNVVGELEGDQKRGGRVLDLGCGTGTVGAAWARASGAAAIQGVDLNRWAVEEARWTYRQFGLSGRARVGDVMKARLDAEAVVLGYVVNELDEQARAALLPRLLESGARVLVIEPIARRVSPWWDSWSKPFVAAGGRADEWRFPIERPEIVRRLDQAARLDHRELKARTLYLSASSRQHA
ncbi:MAG: class I SAM-dependent methyltransferase [Myxococcota bacterium]